MDNSLIIIGAGVAGLTAGCYAQMNGYKTIILEMAETPGGLCTSWKRRGYLFDGSAAGLAGAAPGSPLYRLWEEIGVVRYCPLHYGENFGSIRLPDGRIVTIYTNIDRLESHLLELFPQEGRVIREFTGAIRAVLPLDIPFSDSTGWQAVKDGIRTFFTTLPCLPATFRYGSMTISEFAEKFHDPDLKLVFHNIVHFGGPDVPILTMLLPLAYAHRGMAGIPLKGWLDFARSIERRYLELGGEVMYGKKVTRLMVEAGSVKGVVLSDGEEKYASRVISAADGRFTHSQLLGRGSSEVDQIFRPDVLSDQPVQVNLGVAEDFSTDNGAMTYLFSDAQEAAGRIQHKVTIHNKYYDKSAAPAGKSALTAFLDSEYAWWKELAGDPERYREEKERCAEIVLLAIEQGHPGIRDRVEVVDVSTPLTRERYTGNWMGAMQARKPNSNMIASLLQKSPAYSRQGLDGFYMAGQWVEAWGGITTAAQSGRKVIQAMCKRDGKKFTASSA